MKRRRRALGNNLAFLDVMACGLGAAVLVFLIVKHHTGAEPMIEEAVSDDGQILTMLRQSEAMLEDQVEATARQIENLQTQNEDRENQIEAHKAKQAELEDLQLQIKELKTKKLRTEERGGPYSSAANCRCHSEQTDRRRGLPDWAQSGGPTNCYCFRPQCINDRRKAG